MTSGQSTAADEQLTHRRQRRSTYLVAAIVVIATAALGTATFVGRGTVKSDQLLVSFALMLIPPLIGAVVALVFGRRLIRRMPPTAGADPATKQQIGRALRDGSTDDPRLDALAREEARLRVGQRWLLWLFAVVVLTQLSALVTAANPFTRVLAVLLILLMAGSAWYRWRGLREARRYLAGPPSQP
ncbi:hypothetical protein ABZU25_12985 [Micromonospora sp. NPDC005215]|uniref:hypothetical protein n=1 Tax=Micromonospora sp. NPDC005215 TaxID=3157024 RepID=UPI0033B7636B